MMADRERLRYEALGRSIEKMPSRASFLDVGCGVGAITEYLPTLDYLGISLLNLW